jgi:hypothetical protein
MTGEIECHKEKSGVERPLQLQLSAPWNVKVRHAVVWGYAITLVFAFCFYRLVADGSLSSLDHFYLSY